MRTELEWFQAFSDGLGLIAMDDCQLTRTEVERERFDTVSSARQGKVHFPRPIYRQTWERLSEAMSEREACKTMVGLLALAADGHEAQLSGELEQLVELDQLPDLHALTQLLAPPRGEVPEISVQLPTLAACDALLQVSP